MLVSCLPCVCLRPVVTVTHSTTSQSRARTQPGLSESRARWSARTMRTKTPRHDFTWFPFIYCFPCLNLCIFFTVFFLVYLMWLVDINISAFLPCFILLCWTFIVYKLGLIVMWFPHIHNTMSANGTVWIIMRPLVHKLICWKSFEYWINSR